MVTNLPHSVGYVNRTRLVLFGRLDHMNDSKKILWNNVLTLMIQRYGEENCWRCAKESGVGPGTMTRIKNMETSVGIDTLEKLSALFGVEPYQLLIPGMGSHELTVLKQMNAMCGEQKATLSKIGATLAEPKDEAKKG